ncbi:MAG: ATP-binding cassette domain-containing protein [Treponema sp.]|jgi:ATPase subunit of ABC transporter with duplicated ATPase domains|nr:ATP-binding cassette domain-containing protein [Treponema sp.]
MTVRFNSVYFSYPSSVEPVLRELNLEFHEGWTGITGDNGAGKSTFLMLAAGILEAQAGTIEGAGGIYCPQRTDELPEFWEDFFRDSGNEGARLMSRLGIGADWPYRWESLSHGERKRLQLGLALWRQPPLLAIDEPTNHLDREARAFVTSALESYTGAGLLVSHDRALLDGLCTRCLFIRQGRALLRPGGISQGLAEEEREAKEKSRLRKELGRERDRLASEAEARRRTVEGSKNRLSKKNIDAKDNDARGKINLARLSGRDRTASDQYKRMENRLSRIDQGLSAVDAPSRRKEGITLPAAQARMDRILSLPAGSIPLGGEGRALSFPDLLIRPGERIALTGPNGAGKSSLIRYMVERIPENVGILYIPQEISAVEGRAALDEIRQDTEKNRGEILARYSRLGSDPGLILQSRLPSPGETRKLLIARGVFSNPALIIMDEPTNHLDLTSIRLLEETLAQVPCALLLVSHDEVFLAALTKRRWDIDRRGLMTVRC